MRFLELICLLFILLFAAITRVTLGNSWPHEFFFAECVEQEAIELLSRSLYRSHVLTTFLGPVLGAMMKQVCWHSRRSKAYRGLPEARGQSEAHGDSNLYNTIVGVP